jgi:hypothetical protein
MCESCGNAQTVGAVVNGVYHTNICRACLAELSGVRFSSGAQGFDRRRTYEDHAADTVQPYNASGVNIEFVRLYPVQSEKIFTKQELDDARRKL